MKKCNVRMAEGHVVRCEIGGSPGRNRGKPKRHAWWPGRKPPRSVRLNLVTVRVH